MAASWRLIRSGPLPGGLNMGLDEALLNSVASGSSPAVLRLYRWSTPTLTLGYAQPEEKRISLKRCQELGVCVVRRPTGGRAVLHDREATYAVIARENTPPFASGVLANYQVIAQALQRTLHDLGLPAHFAPKPVREQNLSSPNCFIAPSHYELVHERCKICGSAQRRQGGAFLQHGSIPVELDLERLQQIFYGDAHPAGSRLSQRVGWLNRWLSDPVSIEQVEEALIAAFGRQLGVELMLTEPTEAEWELARTLQADKYPNLI